MYIQIHGTQKTWLYTRVFEYTWETWFYACIYSNTWAGEKRFDARVYLNTFLDASYCVQYIMGISVGETKGVYGYILKDGKGVFGNGVFGNGAFGYILEQGEGIYRSRINRVSPVCIPGPI